MFGTSTLTSKGQATIPEPLRSYLGLMAGDKIYFDIDTKSKAIRLKKASPTSIVDELAGSLKTNMPYEDINIVRQKAGKIYGKKFDIHK